ncbi:MAG: CYTH domain-containing protein [Eubacteriales bacterium]
MSQELELKLGAATPEILDAILNWSELADKIAEPPRTIAMVSRYFDNEKGDFSARRWTLRQRMENETSVITVKAGGSVEQGLHIRNEWEVPGSDPQVAVPALVKLGAPGELVDLLQSPLVVTCGAEFTRRAILLDLGGATVELALDVGMLTKNDKKLHFQEVELELKSGDSRVLETFGQTMQSKFNLFPEPKSKLARGLSL